MRTGDLGFLHQGELYVTGRLTDLIIIRGLNHYPQDIEQTAEFSHAALRPGCRAAFSVDVDGEERLVIVQEVQRKSTAGDQEIVEAIRQRVAEEHEVQVYAVALIRQGTIAKTSSGKIQRNACLRAFVAGQLEVEFEWRETTKANQVATAKSQASGGDGDAESPEGWLQAKLAGLLRVEVAEIEVQQPITRYGLDSLMVVELSHSIEEKFGVAIPLARLFETTSIVQLCGLLGEGIGSPDAGPQNAARPASGEVSSAGQPLSSSQQSLWFLHQLAPEDPTYNLAFAARVRGSLDLDALRNAFQALVDRHESLRTVFTNENGEPVQRVLERATVHFEEHDASQWGQTAPGAPTVLEQTVLNQRLTAEAQRPFDLEHGPLLRVHLFRRVDGENVLLLTAHHIIVDLWSLTVLMHELGVLYGAQRAGTRAELPPLSRQYVDYVHWQNDLLRSELGQSHRRYWQQQLAGPLPGLALPTDRPRPPVQTYRGAVQTFRLNPELTQRGDKARRIATAYWRRAQAVAGGVERHDSAEGNVSLCSSSL